jgi:hypothetical protein
MKKDAFYKDFYFLGYFKIHKSFIIYEIVKKQDFKVF